jgi:hypothetical protein
MFQNIPEEFDHFMLTTIAILPSLRIEIQTKRYLSKLKSN